MAKRGRQTKLTPELQEAFLIAVKESGYYSTACQCLGIGKQTFHDWMTWGKDPKRPVIYRNFRMAIRKRIADNLKEAIEGIQEAGRKGNWFARAWYAERRHSEKWGRDTKLIAMLVKQVGELQAALASVIAAQKTATENPALARANGHAAASQSVN
jgi:hypothetical protein